MGIFRDMLNPARLIPESPEYKKGLNGLNGKVSFTVSSRRREDPDNWPYYHHNSAVTIDEFNDILKRHRCDRFEIEVAYGADHTAKVTCDFLERLAPQAFPDTNIQDKMKRSVPMSENLSIFRQEDFRGYLLFYVTAAAPKDTNKEVFWPYLVLSLNEFNSILATHACHIEDVKFEYSTGNSFFALVSFDDRGLRRNSPFIQIGAIPKEFRGKSPLDNSWYFREYDFSSLDLKGDQVVYVSSLRKGTTPVETQHFYYFNNVMSEEEYDRLISKSGTKKVLSKAFRDGTCFAVLRFS